MSKSIKHVKIGDVLQHPDGRKFTVDNLRELPEPHGVGLDLVDEQGVECVAGHPSVIEAGWKNLGRPEVIEQFSHEGITAKGRATLQDALAGAGMIDAQTDALIEQTNRTMDAIGLVAGPNTIGSFDPNSWPKARGPEIDPAVVEHHLEMALAHAGVTRASLNGCKTRLENAGHRRPIEHLARILEDVEEFIDGLEKDIEARK